MRQVKFGNVNLLHCYHVRCGAALKKDAAMPTSNELVLVNEHKDNSQGFVTGYGQSDTHAPILNDGTNNPHKSAGTRYATITGKEIAAMVKNPPSVDKKAAQWFIPSKYVEHNARSHEAQRQNGSFRCLTLDVDKNDLSLDVMQAVLGDVVGNASYIIHSSRSARETDRKWRAIIFLKRPIAGDQFSDVQNAFFDLLEDASSGVLIPDRALSRPAQLVYLPNKGEFYQYAFHKALKPC